METVWGFFLSFPLPPHKAAGISMATVGRDRMRLKEARTR